jgi:hypothetical protein
MSSNQSHLRAVTPTDGGGSGDASRPQARQRAAKGLPTDRIKMERQYDILATIGRLSSSRNSINADNLARAVGGGIVATTVMLSNRFFADAGWITIPAKGQYAATEPLVQYARRLVTDTPDRAVLELHDPVRQSWFWQELESLFTDGKARVSDAETMLMRAAEASPGHLPMIRNLIAWLEHIGMVTVDDQFIAVKVDVATPAADADDQRAPEHAEKPAETGAEGAKPTEQAVERSPTPVISLSFEVKITMDDLAQLSADQITALFAAVGTVAAVKGRQ